MINQLLPANGEGENKRLVVEYAVAGDKESEPPIEQRLLIVACPGGGGILDNKKTSGGRKSCRNNSLEPTKRRAKEKDEWRT